MAIQVVRDALAQRHLQGRGCFVSDKSCSELAAIGESALPTIERVVLDEVLPFYYCTTESLDRRFPGLFGLLVTYFAIGKDSGADRIFPFFQRLHASVRVEAMRAITLVWLDRMPTAQIPPAFLATVRELSENGTGEMLQVARRLLEGWHEPGDSR